jgi:HPt (histidine-containing phosphotransfer) domain-containing protein
LPVWSRIAAGRELSVFWYRAVRQCGRRANGEELDLGESLERTENDRELMKDLLTIFKEEFPQRLQALSEAVASLNATNVVLEAHALKGMLFNLAAIEAAAAVAELERLGRNNETSKLLESFSRFDAIAKELSRQVEVGMAEVSG